MSLPRDSQGQASSKDVADYVEHLEHRIAALEVAVAYLQRMESARQDSVARAVPLIVPEIQDRPA